MNPLISCPQGLFGPYGVFAPHVHLVPFGLDNLGNWKLVLILFSKILIWIPSLPVLSRGIWKAETHWMLAVCVNALRRGGKSYDLTNSVVNCCGNLILQMSQVISSVRLIKLFVESSVHKNNDK